MRSSLSLLLLLLLSSGLACQSPSTSTDSPRADGAQAVEADASPAITQKETSPGQSAPSGEDAKIADIKKLLVLTGSAKLGKQSMAFLLASFKKSMPQVPAEFWDEFMNEVKEDDLIDLIAPIYAKHYTHDDIQKLIAFYETDIGQKSIQVTPLIMQESQLVGQQWGARLGEKVKERLEKKGYK